MSCEADLNKFVPIGDESKALCDRIKTEWCSGMGFVYLSPHEPANITYSCSTVTSKRSLAPSPPNGPRQTAKILHPGTALMMREGHGRTEN